jgi:hypothetical protein
MPLAAPPVASIQVIMTGLMALQIDRRNNAANRKRHCKLHLLDNVPWHLLTVRIQKWDSIHSRWFDVRPPYTKPEIRKLFWLEVRSNNAGIELVGDGGGAPAPVGDQKPFTQAVDLEEPRLHAGRVQVDMSGVYSTFHMNSGRFYTSSESTDHLISQKMGNQTNHGRVAIEIGADIQLAQGEIAIFQNGDDRHVFAHGESYGITISQNRPEGAPMENDSELYYPTIAGDVPPGRRIRFNSAPHRGAQHDPELDQRHPPEHGADEPDVLREGHLFRIPPHALCFTAVLGEGP